MSALSERQQPLVWSVQQAALNLFLNIDQHTADKAMSSANKVQVIALVAILGIAAFGSIVLVTQFLPANSAGTIKLTLLENAGVMIEADGMRIYVDPIELPSNYSALPADAVLITHPHGDHFNGAIIDLLLKEDTEIIMPSNMSAEVTEYSAVGVVPGDSVLVGDINITAFYMYTIAPEGYEASHPREANWTSYIIDIHGFTIFHAGDSKNLAEYNQLNGTIDVALLPLGPGCQSMAGMEVVDAIDRLQPRYFIPVHASDLDAELFINAYEDDIAEVSECDSSWLEHFASCIFEP